MLFLVFSSIKTLYLKRIPSNKNSILQILFVFVKHLNWKQFFVPARKRKKQRPIQFYANNFASPVAVCVLKDISTTPATVFVLAKEQTIFKREAKKSMDIKRANKTQHKSKLVKMEFSGFFSSCCCNIDCVVLLAKRVYSRNICINFQLFAHFHTYTFVDNSIILLFASYMNSNEFLSSY